MSYIPRRGDRAQQESIRRTRRFPFPTSALSGSQGGSGRSSWVRRCDLFETEGAYVTRDHSDPTDPNHAQRLMETAGTVDVLIANLMARNNRRTADQIDDADWRRMFDVMVHPLYRLARAALPQMLARGRGKIVVIGRANGLRGTSIRSAYSAARGAQMACVRAVDAEVAARGVCINIIAQNRVSNPTSYPPAATDSSEFAARLADVPIWTGGAPRRECGTRPFSRVCEEQLHRWPSDPLCRWLGLTEREKL
jgi:2-keto-3-deoxy-L-fuconate dehydrogenase